MTSPSFLAYYQEKRAPTYRAYYVRALTRAGMSFQGARRKARASASKATSMSKATQRARIVGA